MKRSWIKAFRILALVASSGILLQSSCFALSPGVYGGVASVTAVVTATVVLVSAIAGALLGTNP